MTTPPPLLSLEEKADLYDFIAGQAVGIIPGHGGAVRILVHDPRLGELRAAGRTLDAAVEQLRLRIRAAKTEAERRDVTPDGFDVADSGTEGEDDDGFGC